MSEISVDLARYRDISKFIPQIGDFIICHGWFWGHWFGTINSVNMVSSKISVIRSGIPTMLFTMSENEMRKNSIEISFRDLTGSRSGKYVVLQNGIWFI